MGRDRELSFKNMQIGNTSSTFSLIREIELQPQ